MHVVLLSTSPRENANSDILCDAMLQGLREAGNEGEKLQTGKMDIGPCNACYYCKQNGGTCIQKDDMPAVIEKLKTADAIVFAAPIYFGTAAAQLKLLMDRLHCCHNELPVKKTALILTAGDSDPAQMDAAAAAYKMFLFGLSDAEDRGVLRAAGVDEPGEVATSVYFEQAKEFGRNF